MNKKKRSTFKSVAAGLLAAAMLVTGGCGKSPTGPPGSQGGGTIAVITKQQLSFWDDVKKGAQDACDEFGYDMVYTVADGDNDYVTQIAAINDAINQKAKAIVIAPNSEKDLNEALTKAVDKGIKVVVINSEIDSSMYSMLASRIGSSESDGGTVAAKNAIAAYKNKGGDLANVGKIGIIGHTAGTAENRINGFITRMTNKIAEANGIEVPEENPYAALAAAGGQGGPPAGVQGGAAAGAQTGAAAGAQSGAPAGAQTGAPAGNDNAGAAQVNEEDLTELEKAELVVAKHEEEVKAEGERKLAQIKKNFVQPERCARVDEAKEETKKLLGTDGNGFSILFATNTNTTLGVCAAVEELGLTGKITIVGYNSDEEELAYIRRGVLDGVILQNPYIIGYVGVRYAKQHINGGGTAPTLDTGVTYVNAGNMNDDYIQLLLYPDKY
ncbi:substrate-binding domain-containing protein [Ruminococcus sp.]|uniref:sugar ABC transporter substrate-binding protein n=1 Tax=Ruminococcus sp. TaxID=41978 RepID=UPI0025EFB4C5|nr:substrate-binding domain-containing protein [Ruminococcus sp.]MCR4638531.1 substrate-binding domain-containing protein [Ruminococcus sp.]